MAQSPKTVKKSGKLSNFLSKLNPNTPKKKLLTFVIVFALAGGGYYAYKSFAATAVYTGDQLYSSAYEYQYRSVPVVEKSGTKRGTQVWEVPSGGSVAIKPNYAPILWVNYVRACANIKNDSAKPIDVNIHAYENGNSEAGVVNTRRVESSSNYQRICSNYFKHTGPNYPVVGAVSRGFWDQNVKIRVGSISLEY
jgi:hypothetical protein